MSPRQAHCSMVVMVTTATLVSLCQTAHGAPPAAALAGTRPHGAATRTSELKQRDDDRRQRLEDDAIARAGKHGHILKAMRETMRRRKVEDPGPLTTMFYPERCVVSSVSPDELAAWYGSRGLVTRALSGYGALGGAPTFDRSIERQYDSHGNVIRREETIIDWYPGADYREVTLCEYDRRSNLVSKRTENNFGVLVYRATYSARNQHDLESFESDVDSDGVTESGFVVRYLYDDAGNLVRKLYESDFELDGTVDSRSTHSMAYDDRGHRLRFVQEHDYEADGIADERYLTYATLDDLDRLATWGDEIDYNADGLLDLRSNAANSYDSDGHLAREVYEIDYYGPAGWGSDGIPDARDDSRLTYDSRGNLVHRVTDSHTTDPYAVSDVRSETRYEYDAGDRLVRQAYTVDVYADGTIDSTGTFRWTYDRRGRLVEFLSEFEGYGFGSISRSSATYDARGNIVELVETSYAPGEVPAYGNVTVLEYAAGRSGRDHEE